jgi:hypothetical protein
MSLSNLCSSTDVVPSDSDCVGLGAERMAYEYVHLLPSRKMVVVRFWTGFSIRMKRVELRRGDVKRAGIIN